MYEYVQTATGWVLYWGGADLYREEQSKQPKAVRAADSPPPATRETAADRGPMTTLSA
jgi:hypothetical protein